MRGIAALFVATLFLLPLMAITTSGLEGNESVFPVKIEVSGSVIAEPRQPDATIKGHVRDAVTGNPIAGASVSISGGFRVVLEKDGISISPPLAPERWDGHASTISDENGYYEMRCWSGESWIYVYAGGYREYHARVTISENETKQHDIRLDPKPPKTVRISGYVRDRETGRPIASRPGGEVWMSGAWIYLNNQEEPDWGSVQTDENGYYELVTYPGYSTVDVWANAYYPYRTTIDLKENDNIRLDFSLKPRPGPDSILRGYVRDVGSGKPIEGAWIWAWNEEKFAWAEGRSDQNGYYEMKLVHGYHSISAYAEGYFSYSTTFEIGAGEGLELNLSLKPGGIPLTPRLMRAALAPEGWTYGPMRGGEELSRQWYAVDQRADVTLTPRWPVGVLLAVLIVSALAVAILAYRLIRR